MISIQQVLDAVGHAAPPSAKNQIVYHASVLNHDTQQITQRRRAPVACNVGLCTANVARLHAGCERIPVLQTNGCMKRGGFPKNFGAAIWKLNRQRAMLHFFEQLQDTADGHRRRLNIRRRAAGGTGVHVQLVLEIAVEGACARETS